MSLDNIIKKTEVTQPTHDNLNLNANMQVGNTDVAGGNPVPISGSVTANAGTNLNTSALALEAGGNLAAAAASLSVLDDWDETDRAKVNIIAGQAGVTSGAGAVAANTPRMTLASDDPAVASLSVIDDWDESDRAKANIIVGQAGITAGAGAVAANTPRVTHASDDPVVTSLQLIDDILIVDNAAFTDGTTKVAMAGFIFDEVAGTALTENDAAAARIDSKRAQIMVLEDATTRGTRAAVSQPSADNIPGSSFQGLITVNANYVFDGTNWDRLRGDSTNGADVDVTNVIPGTAATALGKAEDAGHTTGDVGVFILGVRNTANTTSTSADRDYAPLSTDLWDAPISGTRRNSTTLTAINTTYNTTSTETNSSAAVDCSMFRTGTFCAIVTETGAATDITFLLQFSNDGGTTWFDYRHGPWTRYRFNSTTVAAHASNQLKIDEKFTCETPTVRMTVSATGLTSGVDEFVVANATFEFLN